MGANTRRSCSTFVKKLGRLELDAKFLEVRKKSGAMFEAAARLGLGPVL